MTLRNLSLVKLRGYRDRIILGDIFKVRDTGLGHYKIIIEDFELSNLYLVQLRDRTRKDP